MRATLTALLLTRWIGPHLIVLGFGAYGVFAWWRARRSGQAWRITCESRRLLSGFGATMFAYAVCGPVFGVILYRMSRRRGPVGPGMGHPVLGPPLLHLCRHMARLQPWIAVCACRTRVGTRRRRHTGGMGAGATGAYRLQGRQRRSRRVPDDSRTVSGSLRGAVRQTRRGAPQTTVLAADVPRADRPRRRGCGVDGPASSTGPAASGGRRTRRPAPGDRHPHRPRHLAFSPATGEAGLARG